MRTLKHTFIATFQIAVFFFYIGYTNEAHATASRPNIVLILADDFGWGDASCNNPDSPLKTPAIDRIAKEGIRFTNAHTPSAVCTPTRYGLLTGRYPWRSYLKLEVLPHYAPALITEDRTTIASYLKSQDYRTGGFGKWHLGLDWTSIEGDPATWRKRYKKSDAGPVSAAAKGIDHTKPFKNSPVDIGFDTYFGTPSNCGNLKFFIKDNRVFGQPKRDKRGVLRDPAAAARDKVDDIYVAKAIGFIENHEKEHANRPFFVYLPLNAIHGAVLPPKRFKGKTGMGGREDKILWANESVGKILAALDRMKLADDTLLIFTADNGPINSPVARENGHQPTGPYRGLKTTVWDGGTRVPFVARWPGHIPEGVTTDHLIGLTDVLATVAALCGSPLPKGAGPDSVNQLPALLQEKDDIVQRPALVTASYAGFLTIRDDKWKAVFGTKWTGGHPAENNGGPHPETIPPDDPAIGQLFNIADDPFEKSDLWESHPEVVKTLLRELQAIKDQEPDDEFPAEPKND
jgi:arylsulfatase A